MQLIVTKTIGKNKYNFMLEGKTFHDVVMESNKLSFPDVYKCGICESDLLVLGARQAGDDNEYEYTYVKCLKCRGELTFGQKKKGNVYYLRKTESGGYDWKVYEKNENAKDKADKVVPPIKDSDDNDDLPF